MNRAKSLLAKSIAVILATGSCGAIATEANNQLKLIERISIVGHQDDTTKNTGSAYVVTATELAKFEHTNIHSILRSVPGVYLREEDGQGFYPRIGIRASSSGRSDRISIMEDGVPTAMGPYANTSAYFFPNAGRMQTVEVLKGPETLLYGPQTTSGAINFVSTAIPNKTVGFLNTEIGDFSTRKIHANYGGTEGQWGYLLETYQRDTDGHQKIDRSNHNAGIDTEEYLGKLRWQSDANAPLQQQLDIKYQYLQEYGNVSYLGLTDADFARNSNRRYGLSELERMDRGRKGFSVQHQIALTANTLLTSTFYDYETKRIYNRLNMINGIDIGATGITHRINTNAANAAQLNGILQGTVNTTDSNGVRYGHNHQAFDNRGLQLELLHNFNLGQVQHELTVGARRHTDVTYNAVNGISNSIYQQVNGSLVFQRTQTSPQQRGDAKANAFWIADRITLGDLTLLPVVRFEDIETKANLAFNATAAQIAARSTNSLNKTTAGLGANYAIDQRWSMLAGVHQGFAPPGNGVNQGGKGEESTNYEAGIRFRQNKLGVDAVAFYSDYSNALRNCLVANPCAGSVVEGVEQAGQKEVYGLEVGVFAQLYQNNALTIPVRLAYTYTDGKYTKSSDLATGVRKGDVLDYTPKHIASVQVGFEASTGWKSYVAANYSDGSCVTTTCHRADATFLQTEDLLTVDFASQYPLNTTTEVYFKVDNVFDQQKITHRGADGARGNIGRNAALGIRVNF